MKNPLILILFFLTQPIFAIRLETNNNHYRIYEHSVKELRVCPESLEILNQMIEPDQQGEIRVQNYDSSSPAFYVLSGQIQKSKIWKSKKIHYLQADVCINLKST
jgi:hypothetical protein